MPEETAVALQEIASLLRRRVEQQAESMRRSEQDTAKLDAELEARPIMVSRQEESKKWRDEMSARAEQQRMEEASQRKQQQDEERQFKQQLIAELQRHNNLLERLLEKIA